MEPWHLPGTYAMVRKAFGAEQERLVRESIRSVQDRQAFCAYHFHEAIRLHRAFERKHLKDRMLLDIYTQDGKRRREAFEVLMIKAGAHSLAAVQSVHAIPDTLAHAIYFATGLNLGGNALPERKVALPTVVGALAPIPALRDLARLLKDAQAGDAWLHLAAVCNVSKHRSVVRASLSEDWTGTRKNFRELHVSAFSRDGVQYPQVSFQALVEPEYDRLTRVILEVGNALNAHLREIAA